MAEQTATPPTPSPATTIVATDGVPSQSAGGTDPNRGDVSAVTVARMMGLATLGEVKLIENKIDLLSTKLSLIQVKVEKVVSTLQGLPTGADMDRLDVHIGAIKQILREIAGEKAVSGADAAAAKKPSTKIVASPSMTPPPAPPAQKSEESA